MSIIPPYPLQWPQGVDRTPIGRRERSPFRTGYPKAVDNVVKALNGFQKDSGFKIEHPVLSSNVDLMGRLAEPDSGVAAWFLMDGQYVCFPVDRFNDAASNVQAIYHIIEARRVEVRYGGPRFIRQAFRSFLALPAPVGSHWSDLLCVSRSATKDEIEAAYRAAAKDKHPDRGGTHEEMSALTAARAAALKELA